MKRKDNFTMRVKRTLTTENCRESTTGGAIKTFISTQDTSSRDDMTDESTVKALTEEHPPTHLLNDYHALLSTYLDFHQESTTCSLHNFHAFAAKFPPQLPRLFIESLTQESDTVLDPMAGSGTALVEAVLRGRHAIGVDVDPLAYIICRAKTDKISYKSARNTLSDILFHVRFYETPQRAEKWIRDRFDEKTKEFVDFWFERKTQIELAMLMHAMEDVITDVEMKTFFLGVFSSIIITKSGGVSKARDLAHTRPHRDTKKNPRDALDQFRAKGEKSVAALSTMEKAPGTARIIQGDARTLPLSDNSVDLIVTSPPYANSIDYVRAHKFSLVWFGWPVDVLSRLRSMYVGTEQVKKSESALPVLADTCCKTFEKKDAKRGNILRQYFCDMSSVLCEMYRVLRSDAAAVVVIGTSTSRGMVIPHHSCLKAIGEQVGFECVKIGERTLERDRRMMPVARESTRKGIENRLHNEYVLGFWKG